MTVMPLAGAGGTTIALATCVAALATSCAESQDDNLHQDEIDNGHVENIVNGNTDDTDVSVVTLSRGGVVSCSATLIADELALTAAHCVLPTPPDAVLVGAIPSSATRIEIKSTRADPQFDPGTLEHDIALVELAGSAGVAPTRPADAQAGKAIVSGATVTVVGFGGTGPADLTPRRRRAGTVVVADVAATSFTATPSPAVPCGGDSGGAALLDVGGESILVGVVSSGNVLCDSAATYTRVDTASLEPASSGGCQSSSTTTWPTSIWLALTLAWRIRRRRTIASHRVEQDRERSISHVAHRSDRPAWHRGSPAARSC